MHSTDDEKPHIRWAVKESKIILLLRIVSNAPTNDFKAIWERFQQWGFKSTRVVRIRKTKKFFVLCGVDALSDVHLRLSKYLVERISPRVSGAQNARRITLRIHVDNKNALAPAREGMGKVDGYGGFPNASLVVHDRDDVAHMLPSYTVSKLIYPCILCCNCF